MSEQNFEGDIPGSFRDPSGFLFKKGGLIFRQINKIYKENYQQVENTSFKPEVLVDTKRLNGITCAPSKTGHGNAFDIWKKLPDEIPA